MAIFTVHEPRGVSDPLERAERTTFVRDGFSWAAFLFGPLYLLRHRAWLGAALWVAGAVLGALAVLWLHLPAGAGAALLLLLMLFTGLEASSARRLALYGRGLDAAGLAAGRKLEEGERAFFAGAEAPARAGSPPPGRPYKVASPRVIGDIAP